MFVYRTQEVLGFDFKTFGDLYKSLQIRLHGVGTPLRNSSRVLAELLSEPFVGALLIGKNNLDAVDVLVNLW